MSGKILIIDPIATSRIVLKVKMMAAQYAVETCENCVDAAKVMADLIPDLILINLTETSKAGFEFCRNLRSTRATRDIAIISTGATDTAQARFRALDAGADDVLPRPLNDALLLSRVRNLVRRRNANAELIDRDAAGRMIGFEEDAAPSLAPASVSVVCYNSVAGVPLLNQLQEGLGHPVQLLIGPRQFSTMLDRGTPDVLVVHGADGMIPRNALLQQICDFSARAQTRQSAQLVIVPDDEPELAAMLLDMGASDVVPASVEAAELALRTQRLIQAKRNADRVRQHVRTGLRAAVTDPLTGLHNRRFAETRLRQMRQMAHQTGESYAVIMLDIDHFKAINDRYGHAAGDRVLVELAQRLQDVIGDDDLVARVGGEEFLIAMFDTGIEGAERAGEALRKIINAAPFVIGKGHDPLRVTVSVGIAVQSEALSAAADDTALGEMFERADAALYSAKSAGRDAISVWSSAA